MSSTIGQMLLSREGIRPTRKAVTVLLNTYIVPIKLSLKRPLVS